MSGQAGGKLPPAVLERLVLGYRGADRAEVVRGAGIGVDAAVLRLGAGTTVFSVDPITGSGSRLGELSVQVACNDLAAAGAEPVAVGITLLVPVELGEGYVARFMADADRACQGLKVTIACGHTELVPGLPAPLVCVAAMGQPWPGCQLPEGPRERDALVLTKGAGIEGAAILATDFPAELGSLVSSETVARAQSLFDSLSVVPEARIAVRHGASGMHDVTEGGLLGAVWEMVHHLVRVLEAGGEQAAAALLARLGGRADVARELCYRLYTVCERKKRAAEALSYNALVQSWAEIARLARESTRLQVVQGTVFSETGK